MCPIWRVARRLKRDENQLHAAVVELVALDDAEIKYSTVQNWYPGDADGQGRNLQFRDEARRRAAGRNSKVSWTQVETGSAITWKYPSVHFAAAITRVGEFYSVAITNNRQQADTGTKMIHIGKNTTSSRIVSKGISAGSLVRIHIVAWCGCSPQGGPARATITQVRLAC